MMITNRTHASEQALPILKLLNASLYIRTV